MQVELRAKFELSVTADLEMSQRRRENVLLRLFATA